MNYRGSSRRLIANAVAAALAAIEIYNKPQFSYRNEVVSILLSNAWELLLKSIVSKSGKSIYEPKKRGQPYRTIGIFDAYRRASKSTLWPAGISAKAIEVNLTLLVEYRNRSVHFYNELGFGVITYAIMQTAIHNFRDVVAAVYGRDLADEITWEILPLGVRAPIDPVDYLKNAISGSGPSAPSPAVVEYLEIIRTGQAEATADGGDLNRVLTLYAVSLQSTKKLEDADLTVGVDKSGSGHGTVVERKQDPNLSHPLRQKDVLSKISRNPALTGFTFQAITHIKGWRTNPRYCWKDASVNLVKWSNEIVALINSMTETEINDCVESYKAQRSAQQKSANSAARGDGAAKARPW